MELDLDREVLLAVQDQEVGTSEAVVPSIRGEPGLCDDGNSGGDRRHGGLLCRSAIRRVDPDHVRPHGISHCVEHGGLVGIPRIDSPLFSVASLSAREVAQ
jgi:hypothetical protein